MSMENNINTRKLLISPLELYANPPVVSSNSNVRGTDEGNDTDCFTKYHIHTSKGSLITTESVDIN
jgi:hypothetical protein